MNDPLPTCIPPTRSCIRPPFASRPSCMVLLFAAVAGVAACAPSGGDVARAARASDSTGAAVIANGRGALVTTPAATSLARVPATIEALGHHGEDAYDHANARQWPKLRASTDSLRAAAADFALARPTDRDSLVPAMQALTAGVAARKRDVAMRAANEITRIAAQLSVPYHPQVPADVTLLDYEGRELEIWAQRGDLPRLGATQRRVHDVWAALRPGVVARGGATEAGRFDALVARLDAARTAVQYAALATPILDEVDALENVYTR